MERVMLERVMIAARHSYTLVWVRYSREWVLDPAWDDCAIERQAREQAGARRRATALAQERSYIVRSEQEIV